MADMNSYLRGALNCALSQFDIDGLCGLKLYRTPMAGEANEDIPYFFSGRVVYERTTGQDCFDAGLANVSFQFDQKTEMFRCDFLSSDLSMGSFTGTGYTAHQAYCDMLENMPDTLTICSEYKDNACFKFTKRLAASDAAHMELGLDSVNLFEAQGSSIASLRIKKVKNHAIVMLSNTLGNKYEFEIKVTKDWFVEDQLTAIVAVVQESMKDLQGKYIHSARML